MSFDLFHGDAAFKPVDWRVKLTPVFDITYLDVQELAVVNPNVNDGTTRFRDWWALQEWFAEAKIADTSPDFDFTSLRVGSQPFLSDFRGFIFEDTNRAVRLFGTNNANRGQFNVYYQYWQEKETNSELNTFIDRPKQTLIINGYLQDFIFPGYTAQLNFIYDRDKGDLEFDRNDFLVRPDPAGVAAIHSVNSYYLGWTGDGHINRWNIDHAFYWVLGEDTLNPSPATSRASALKWRRSSYRTTAIGPASARRSFLPRAITNLSITTPRASTLSSTIRTLPAADQLLGSAANQAPRRQPCARLQPRPRLTQQQNPRSAQLRESRLVPGQFRCRFRRHPQAAFDQQCELPLVLPAASLEAFLFQPDIDRFIGTDLSLGFEYRPHLNNNIIVVGGIQGLVPGEGFRDIYNPIVGQVPALFAGFMNLQLRY